MVRRSYVFGLLIAFLATLPAFGQSYPNRPVRLIVPYAPGGSVDLIGRLLATKLTDSFKQPVVIENRPGAGGAIGVQATVNSPPDGHTFVITGNGAVTVNVHLHKLPYDALADLTPITMLTTVPIVIGVHPSLPVRSLANLVAHAKSLPNTLNYSSNGAGSVAHLSAELFKRLTGIDMTHVVYRGAAPASQAIVAGDVQVGFVDASSAKPFAEAGSLRLLAVTSHARSAIVPNLPTVAESGFPNFDVAAWTALFAPARTPASIVELLNAKTTEALKARDFHERVLALQMEPAPTSVAEIERVVRTESARWETLIKEANIKAE